MNIKEILNESTDEDFYKETINTEQKISIKVENLVVGQKYYPIDLNATLKAKLIVIFTTKDGVIYTNGTSERLEFKDINNKISIFPAKNHKMGDGSIDLLIFNNEYDRQAFISLVRLKFAGWRITEQNL